MAALAGLALGSFAVTAGVRMSRGEGFVSGRSRCDDCGQSLGFAQTIPLLSYLGLRGACSVCGARIDPIHAIGEALGAGVLATSLFARGPLATCLTAALGLVLIAAAANDWKVRRLPDALTAAAALLATALAALQGAGALLSGFVAAGLAAATLLGLRWARARWRGEAGLGMGDVKLIAALALWLGVETPWMVVAAAIGGLGLIAMVRPADGRLPFGPAIAAAGFVVGVGGEMGIWPTPM